MKLFLDTASIEEIKQAVNTGLIDGITTNPTLVAQAGRNREEVIQEICQLVDGPISAEVLSTTTEAMLAEGLALAKLHKNITVKLPMIKAAMPVVQALSAQGIMTNVTLVFTANQALLAAKSGATFISPFVGRLDDQHVDGMAVVADILQVLRNYKFSTQVLVASVRSPEHVLQATKLGADVATIPYKIFEQLFQHPLTESGLAKFLQDAKQSS